MKVKIRKETEANICLAIVAVLFLIVSTMEYNDMGAGL